MVKARTWFPLPAACLGAAAVLASTHALADEGASGSKSFTRGDSIALGLKSRTGLLLTRPTYAPACAAKQGI